MDRLEDLVRHQRVGAKRTGLGPAGMGLGLLLFFGWAVFLFQSVGENLFMNEGELVALKSAPAAIEITPQSNAREV